MNKKIKTLEKIIKVFVGKPDGVIEYDNSGEEYGILEVECDPDNIPVIASLSELDEISVFFYVGWHKEQKGKVMAMIVPQKDHAKENEELKEEVKKLRKNIEFMNKGEKQE